VISGGAESAATITAVAGFANMTALSTTKVSKPFDATRDGFIFGEGAAVFVLERLDLALARNAKIYGEVLGAGSNADAHHITAPSPGGVGAIACMRLALDDAGLSPSDIKQVNAHGTSTPLNDAAEASAVAEVFGSTKPPMTSIKGVTGHPLGAAGALEAAAVLLSFEHKLIPPTANTSVVDPQMSNVDIVTGSPRPYSRIEISGVDAHASTMTKSNSHSQAISPFTFATPEPFPARADIRPRLTDISSTSPGTT
jgi:3-oxoacyl-[acyl-carrier-protein] synthase II